MFMQLQFTNFWKQLTHTAIDSEQYEVLKTNLLGMLKNFVLNNFLAYKFIISIILYKIFNFEIQKTRTC